MDVPTSTVSTYPDSDDEAKREEHREMVKLEREGKVRRHLDMEKNDQGAKYVIWVPTEPGAAQPDDDQDRP